MSVKDRQDCNGGSVVQAQSISRFSVQRLDTADIIAPMPRRRASVTHAGSADQSGNSSSAYVNMEDGPFPSYGRPSVNRG